MRSAGIDLEPAGRPRGDVETVAAAANRLLAPVGVALVIVDEDSDAYPIIAVPLDRVPRILQAAEQATATVRLPRTRDVEPNATDTAKPSTNSTGGPPSDVVTTDAGAHLRDPRQSLEHYQACLDTYDVAQEITSARRAITMAVDTDQAALAATIRHVIGVLGAHLTTRYALGVPVSDLAGDVRTLASLWSELDTTVGDRWQSRNWARAVVSLRRNADSAITAVHALSWAVALGEQDSAAQLLATHAVREARLPVVGHLARMIGLDAPVDGPMSHAKLWQPWIDVVEARDRGGRQAAFEVFVTGYPQGLKRVRRLVTATDAHYPGQFAFEAAPLAIHLGLDDRALRGLPDHPADLVGHGQALSVTVDSGQ